MAGKQAPKVGAVSVRLNEETDRYELGAEIDGQFVKFTARDADDVHARVAQLADDGKTNEREPVTPA